LDFRGPITGSLKSPCTNSYRSSTETIALNCLVFEKIAFLPRDAMHKTKDQTALKNQKKNILRVFDHQAPRATKRIHHAAARAYLRELMRLSGMPRPFTASASTGCIQLPVSLPHREPNIGVTSYGALELAHVHNWAISIYV